MAPVFRCCLLDCGTSLSTLFLSHCKKTRELKFIICSGNSASNKTIPKQITDTSEDLDIPSKSESGDFGNIIITTQYDDQLPPNEVDEDRLDYHGSLEYYNLSFIRTPLGFGRGRGRGGRGRGNFSKGRGRGLERDVKGPDWDCTLCGNTNWSWRSNCNRCQTAKPITMQVTLVSVPIIK